MRIRTRQQQHPVEISSALSATAGTAVLVDPKNNHAVRSTDSTVYSLSRYKKNWLEKLREAKGLAAEPLVQIHELVSSLAKQHEKQLNGEMLQPDAGGHPRPAVENQFNQANQKIEQPEVYFKSADDDCIEENQLSKKARSTNPWVSPSPDDRLEHGLPLTKQRDVSGNSVEDRERTARELSRVNAEEETVQSKSDSQCNRVKQVAAGNEEQEDIDSGPESAFYEYIFGISSTYAGGRRTSSLVDFSKKHKRKQFKPRLCPKSSDTCEQDIAGSTGDVTETAKLTVTESAGENVSSKFNQCKDQSLQVFSPVMRPAVAGDTEAIEPKKRAVNNMRQCNGRHKQDMHIPVRENEEKYCASKGRYFEKDENAISNNCMPTAKDLLDSVQDWNRNCKDRLTHSFSSKIKGPRTIRGGKPGIVASQSITSKRNQITSEPPPAEVKRPTLLKTFEAKGSMKNLNGLASKSTIAEANPVIIGAGNLLKTSDITFKSRDSQVLKIPVDHPVRQPKETLVFSVYQVFAEAGRVGLTAREAVSKILEGGLPGLHEGGVIPRVEVGKILRTSPYFMELEESKYVLCSAVVGAEGPKFFEDSNALQEGTKVAAEENPSATKTGKPRGNLQYVATLAAIRKARTGTSRRKSALDEIIPDSVTVQKHLADEHKPLMSQKKRLKSVKQDSSRLGNRCNRSDGKGWHCPLYAQVGYLLCDHHLEKLRLKSTSRSRSAQ